MTPEEKAQEIINKIRTVVERQPMTISYENTRQISIKSAIICVNEILNSCDSKELTAHHPMEGYWQSVKQEIQLL